MPAEPTPTLLLAEDDDALRALLGRALRREGYTVHEAPDGQALLELAAGVQPDLIVSDVHMPRLSGPAALRRLRFSGVLCPAIFITAFGVADARPEVAALGGCSLLEKPVDLAELRELVRGRLEAGGWRLEEVGA